MSGKSIDPQAAELEALLSAGRSVPFVVPADNTENYLVEKNLEDVSFKHNKVELGETSTYNYYDDQGSLDTGSTLSSTSDKTFLPSKKAQEISKLTQRTLNNTLEQQQYPMDNYAANTSGSIGLMTSAYTVDNSGQVYDSSNYKPPYSNSEAGEFHKYYQGRTQTAGPSYNIDDSVSDYLSTGSRVVETKKDDEKVTVPQLKSRKESDEGKLFVGGLSWDTTDETLFKHFSKYGKLVDCIVMKDGTAHSRGFAFVTYEDSRILDRVVLDKHIIDGKQVDPKCAIPREAQVKSEKMFVGQLPSHISESDVEAFFSHYGRIIDVAIMIDSETGLSRGFGFITFESEEGLRSALAAGPHSLEGVTLETTRALPKNRHTVASTSSFTSATRGSGRSLASGPPSRGSGTRGGRGGRSRAFDRSRSRERNESGRSYSGHGSGDTDFRRGPSHRETPYGRPPASSGSNRRGGPDTSPEYFPDSYPSGGAYPGSSTGRPRGGQDDRSRGSPGYHDQHSGGQYPYPQSYGTLNAPYEPVPSYGTASSYSGPSYVAAPPSFTAPSYNTSQEYSPAAYYPSQSYSQPEYPSQGYNPQPSTGYYNSEASQPSYQQPASAYASGGPPFLTPNAPAHYQPSHYAPPGKTYPSGPPSQNYPSNGYSSGQGYPPATQNYPPSTYPSASSYPPAAPNNAASAPQSSSAYPLSKPREKSSFRPF